MTHIIISYRRADSDAIAGRIRDKLATHFGENSVFMDIDSIPFGIDFREHIQQAPAQNDILVAVTVRNGSALPRTAVCASPRRPIPFALKLKRH
jgi:hypothetical protein